MKRIAFAALVAGLAATAASADGNALAVANRDSVVQPTCPSAPAVARTYLAAQAGRKLTMTRAEIVAEITRLTGSDGEFAGLKPCDAGYPNSVRFWIDEVLKVGTQNSP